MWVSIDLCLIPVGEGTSLSPYIAACKEVLEKTGLDYEMGPNGTAIEGEWEDVFASVKSCHEVLHEKGVVRIYTTLKINTRVDKKESFRKKVLSVQEKISKGEMIC